ncbi:Alpha/Beta hydrolase protein [Penicillium cosmopolitanum]|uniref:Alpha/Beta hydrolase protein n=1 Tax=Penicillium cosmopolitanum TaxID=1131564 RepID=A0A9W9WAA9_9EURO|nr:Alpha/Beta hydrolase protein [Penicillium cosmopolitanum]KAJ5413830.1 Alpha/Beta hydrolase protein [Penicillium cosmopolitanum]
MGDCCLKGFRWTAQPRGRETALANIPCYVTGSNAEVAILVIHDLFGWTFPNIRLLADHYAEEVDATVYVPDFFGGEVLPLDILQDKSRWGSLNLPAFLERNAKAVREPQIIECAVTLRAQYRRTGAIGYCFGGWGVFRLGAKGRNLVDCISTAHPSFLEKSEIESVNVPVQIMAPEFDPMFTDELKLFCNSVLPTLGVAYEYHYFPQLEHAFAVRGNPNDPAEMKGMRKAKDAAVVWFRQWLHDTNI